MFFKIGAAAIKLAEAGSVAVPDGKNRSILAPAGRASLHLCISRVYLNSPTTHPQFARYAIGSALLSAHMPRLVPVNEAAKELGIGSSTIFRYLRLGLIKKHKRQLDRKTYVDIDELRELRDNPPFLK